MLSLDDIEVRYPHRGVLGISSRLEDTKLRHEFEKSLFRLAPLGITPDQSEISAWSWGEPAPQTVEFGTYLLLTLGPRRSQCDLSPDSLGSNAETVAGTVGDLIPPFGVLQIEGDRIRGLVDNLGFCHLYIKQLKNTAAVSTSARVLDLLNSQGVSAEAVAVQSLVGWQVGLRSMFAGVRKLAPGGSVELNDGRLGVHEPAVELRSAPTNDPAKAAAEVLRVVVNAYLDEHPDAELQLTGGLDSRILLAAIPPARRRCVRVMTLEIPGNEDTEIAAELSHRYGMQHRLANMLGLADLSPAAAFGLCLNAARRVDSTVDPVALAAVDFAELTTAEPCPRIAGLGGEVARGFYYFGPVRRVPVTRRRVQQLARWRIFSNEAAPTDMFDPTFARWAREFVVDDLMKYFEGDDWFRALDEFYLGQRLHRWAGVLASATALERSVVNPMLDPQFLAIARGVPPEHKKNARFLSQILLELDTELGDVRLDGRPTPATYASPGLSSRIRIGRTSLGRVTGKVRQRLRRTHRAPEGGEVLSSLVVRHWRDNPYVLNPIRQLGFIAECWLDRVLTGSEPIETSAVAMLTNLLAAQPDD